MLEIKFEPRLVIWAAEYFVFGLNLFGAVEEFEEAAESVFGGAADLNMALPHEASKNSATILETKPLMPPLSGDSHGPAVAAAAAIWAVYYHSL